MSDSSHAFSATERAAVYRAIAERRDMRHFSGGSVAPELLAAAGGRAPGAQRRPDATLALHPYHRAGVAPGHPRLVEDERGRTAGWLHAAQGVLDCAELLVAALMDDRERHVFGRRTLPQMDLASLACAIQNLWLASRAEGLGMGWVSLFDPAALGELLGLPPGSEAVAVLCLGPVAEFYPAPMLALEGWSEPRPLAELVYQNRWGERA